jgi:hypothetical protein
MNIATIDHIRNRERTQPWSNVDAVRAENVKLKRRVESLRRVLEMTGDVEPVEPVLQMPQTVRARTVSRGETVTLEPGFTTDGTLYEVSLCAKNPDDGQPH